MRINVLKTHIKNGLRGTPDSCPIALAIRSQLHPDEVNVYGDHVNFGGHNFNLPEEAADFITLFDDEDIPKSQMKPFSFEL